MSENYFYSSLSGQEIEDTLVGAVRFNAAQNLTTSEKEIARQNIGAGTVDTGLVIKGYYDTAADLESAHPMASEGDAYMVGTAAPYDVYIWDNVGFQWVNNGPLTPGDSVIDDNDLSSQTTWSSIKINTQLSGKQAAISAVGMLKGTGSAVQAATKGTDYGALSFTVTLLAASWSNNALTISNANFLASGYAYIVAPAGASFAAYGEAQIYADDVTVDGSMTFHCDSAPSADLTVNIARVVSA